MKKEYDRNYYVVKADDAQKNFDDNGFSRTELLPGVYDGGITSYKCFLKSGGTVTPELYADKGVVMIFGQGKGVLKDKDGAHSIMELAFYVPNFDKAPYEITAEEELEFVINIIEFNEWDWQSFHAWHIGLPYFRLHSECVPYIQDCKGPNTEARMVLCPKWFGRVLMGTTRAIGEGTVEDGHPAVHQWNYCVGSSDFTMSVGYKARNSMENENHKAGDWSFIPAGADHDLVADPGKEVYYVWFEHFTDEKKFAKES